MMQKTFFYQQLDHRFLTFLAIHEIEIRSRNSHHPLWVAFQLFVFQLFILYKNRFMLFIKSSRVSRALNATHVGGVRIWEGHSEIAKNLMLLVPVHLGRSLSGALGVGFLFSLRRRGTQTQTGFFKRVEEMAATLP